MIFALSGTFAHAESGSLVVLGDSITTGYGLDGYTAGDNSSAAGSFANQLSAGYAEYSNFAVDGRTSGELLTALEDEDVSAALAGAETVVISIGGNDFLQPMISAVMSAAISDPSIKEMLSGGVQSSSLFSIMISRMVRSVSTMPGVLTRPILRMACSGVAPQMPSVDWRTTSLIAR